MDCHQSWISATKNIQVWYVVYKEKKDVNWRVGAIDLIVLMEFVCVAAGEGAMI